MKTTLIAAGVTLSLCAALNASPGQTPATQPQTPAPAKPTQRATPASATTLTGCLYRERDVPGRTPNVAEKAGVLEDYIVADARIVGQGSSAPGAVAGTVGTMYKVEGIPDEQLRALVGKRVEVAGRIDTDDENGPTGVARPDRNPASPDAVNLSDFEATSIREVTGGTACAAKPAAAPVVPR